MNNDTGEIKFFADDEELPKNWSPMPRVGDEVSVLVTRTKFGAKLTKKHRAKVAEINEGTPGTLVLEMLPNKD